MQRHPIRQLGDVARSKHDLVSVFDEPLRQGFRHISRSEHANFHDMFLIADFVAFERTPILQANKCATIRQIDGSNNRYSYDEFTNLRSKSATGVGRATR